MIYRLLAINIDGTLLKSNGRLTKETKEAIGYVKNKGVYVTLVTGRNFAFAKKVAKSLKLDTFLITHGGAFIASKLDQPLHVKRISEDKTFNLVQVLENYDCTVRILHERYSIGNRLRGANNLMARAVLGSSDPLIYPMQFVESLGDTLMDNPIAPPKIEVYFTEPEERDKVVSTLKTSFEEIEVQIHEDGKVDILPDGGTKLDGLLTLGDVLKISPQEMVVIGDSLEDLPLIEVAGLGVAMGNAPKEVKQVADWITRTNDESGVAYMIKEHFRMQQRISFLNKMKI
ncbi:Cof-type HAD-IIB family hydrolase [Sutcliffiella deserti]|uniref:Cof-type HAD-IIB family hydrolase n=1 Tax=Sutcliffiella deserti TaxID=2875501 RepID=UPI001CBC433F|nr:Cof-type HAD-IIB family hydrolase [Sutcliffiella deserti]